MLSMEVSACNKRTPHGVRISKIHRSLRSIQDGVAQTLTQHPRLTPHLPQTGTSEHDARNDEDKLAENRKDLGVKLNHKTDEMEKSERGTFQ